jgi:TrmH family RNA methyltransferase
MIKEITSVNNQYIKELLTLRDKQVRNNTNLFIVEGYHLVEESLKHQVLEAVLCTDKEVLEKIDVDEKYLVSEQVIKKLSSTKTP